MLGSRQPRRSGFTLLELLVVIAIIVVLTALAVAAGYNVMQGQKAGRTEDFIRATDKILQAHWRKVVDDAGKEDPSPAAVTMADGDRARAKVIWIKFRLMEAFPQNFAEIGTAAKPPWIYGTDSQGQQYIPQSVRKHLSTYQTAIQSASGTQPTTQSGACLYLFLRENRGGNKFDDEKFPANILDTDNDGLKEFVDNWGKPLTFIRFPIGSTGTPSVLSATLLAELNQQNPNKTTKGQSFGDPLDPDGTLSVTDITAGKLWFNVPAPAGKNFTANIHTVAATQPYFVPVLISNGPDGIFNTADDIYSWRLRLGAKGD